MATVVTVNGSTVNFSTSGFLPTNLQTRFRGVSTFTFRTETVDRPTSDPYVGKPITVTINGTLRFTGDILGRTLQKADSGAWISAYQCYDLRFRGDRIPMVDEDTQTDQAVYNLPPDNPNYDASRAGRTVGQIVTSILEGATNAAALTALGIGNYTVASGVYTLPSVTSTDLAALTIIPPQPCMIGGEKLLSGIDSWLQNVSPNTYFWVDPSGNLRFGDTRQFTVNTLVEGTDPIEPVEYTVDGSQCYSKVVVKGANQTMPVLLTLANGDLTENFAWGAYTNATAKANWLPTDYTEPASNSQDYGTCTCTSTTTVVVTSADPTATWTANFWDWSTGNKGYVLVRASTLGGLANQFWSARIISNTALSAGGTSTLTLDVALPNTSFDSYRIYGATNGANRVYRVYQVTNTAIRDQLALRFRYPVAFVGSNGNTAELTSYPVATLCYSSSGSPPYTEEQQQFDINTTTGEITFWKPTALVFGGGTTTTPVNDVRFLAAVNVASLQAVAPSSGFEGTYYSGVLGGSSTNARTLTVTVDDWIDPANQSGVDAYAQDLLDSVKDTVIEGSVTYYGLYEPVLDFGQAIKVTGNNGSVYTTGLEGTLTSFTCNGLPVQEVSLTWGPDTTYVETITFSNRRAHYSVEMFLRPDRQFSPIGTPQGILTPLGNFSDQDTFGVSDVQNLQQQQMEAVQEQMQQLEQPQQPKQDQQQQPKVNPNSIMKDPWQLPQLSLDGTDGTDVAEETTVDPTDPEGYFGAT